MVGDILYFILILGLGGFIGAMAGMYLGVKKFIIDQLPYTGTPSERVKKYIEEDVLPMLKEETSSFIHYELKPDLEQYIKDKIIPYAESFLDDKLIPEAEAFVETKLKPKLEEVLDDKIIPEAEKLLREKLIPAAKEYVETDIKPTLNDKVVKPVKDYMGKEITKVQSKVTEELQKLVDGPIKESLVAAVKEALKDLPSVPTTKSKK